MLWIYRLYTLAHHKTWEDKRVYNVFLSKFKTSLRNFPLWSNLA